ncbi:MurR/RpiR family transcriptional regulator [Nocardiopsis salina]|uniref:MurR/RpiR family transcriptional regulator n=1 Tax=Nocardiopsis salina TaxID=245836 RepID=UPI00034B190B|nr:MurR/RpiR family transcriptional regulator [Nocardiopsis salina]
MSDWIAQALEGARLGRASERVVSVLREEPRFASYASTADLAERAEVNVATVVRVAQQLGFSGWPTLRAEVRSRYLTSLSGGGGLTEHAGSDADPVDAALAADRATLGLLERAVDREQVRAVASAVHRAGRTLVLGSGTFAAPGVQLSHAAGIMGYDVRLGELGGTAVLNTLARMGSGDLLVVCDLWMLPVALRRAVEVAVQRSVGVAVITDREGSPLVTSADQVVVVPSEGVGVLPSLTAAMAVVHAVLAELTSIGGPRVLDSVREAERLWREAELF